MAARANTTREKVSNEILETLISFTVDRTVKNGNSWDVVDNVRQAMIDIWRYECHVNDGSNGARATGNPGTSAKYRNFLKAFSVKISKEKNILNYIPILYEDMEKINGLLLCGEASRESGIRNAMYFDCIGSYSSFCFLPRGTIGSVLQRHQLPAKHHFTQSSS